MTGSFMVVGSLNRKTPYFEGANGVGLSVLAFDPESGRARLVCEERDVDNPTFLCVEPATRCVYANSEMPAWPEGRVTAFRFLPGEGRLLCLNHQSSLGSITAHCSLAVDRRHLLVANYGGFPEGEGLDRAVAVLPLRADGCLGPPVSSVGRSGGGVNPVRQDRSHPHCVLPSPDGRFVLVADLGQDAVASYAISVDGQLSREPVATIRLRAGAGPRHLAFHPGEPFLFVISELDSTISSMRYDAASGRFGLISTVPTLPGEGTANACSDILVHLSGRRLYGANRGHDSIVVVDVATDGTLSVLAHRPSGGRTPRHMALDPKGRNLIVANQDGDVLSVHRLDGYGMPIRHLRQIAIGTPMCVAFLG